MRLQHWRVSEATNLRLLWVAGGSQALASHLSTNLPKYGYLFYLFKEMAPRDNDRQNPVPEYFGDNLLMNRMSGKSKKRPKKISLSSFRSSWTTYLKSTAIVGECPICFEEVTAEENASLTCNHVVCKSCAKDYMTSLINDARVDSETFTCPGEDCACEYNPYHVLELCGESALEKYIRFKVDKKFEISPYAVYCANKKCGKLLVSNPDTRKVVCTNNDCQKKTCSYCKKRYHIGPCRLRFRVKSSNDYKFKMYVLRVGAKHCPRCKAVIEKTQGCNHMTCGKCRFEFCWLCKQKYTSGHFSGPFSCSSYRNYDIWGPVLPVRIFTKTVGGSLIIIAGSALVVFGAPYFLIKHGGNVVEAFEELWWWRGWASELLYIERPGIEAVCYGLCFITRSIIKVL